MITKLAKAQKSWLAKLILILTALSFMSLFGVAGYIQSAGENRTVIKVDDVEISQAQFSYLLQKELNAAQNLLNEDEEISDEMRESLIAAQIQTLVNESVLDRSAEKYHIMFHPLYIKSLILNEPSFKIGGEFNQELFRRVLSENQTTEAEYTNALKRDLIRRILVDLPVSGVNVPAVYRDLEQKADNKRRTFKYVRIVAQDMHIDRQISDDEIEQYYEDFTANFQTPETRDVSVLTLKLKQIADQMEIAPADIENYYQENISNYETPDKRDLLQMMFDDADSANDAYASLQNGADFYQVASDKALQSKAETELGLTAEEELLPEIGPDVFDLPINGFTKPFQNNDRWQILKVVGIENGTKTSLMKAAVEIKNILKDERLYDEAYQVLNNMEDSLAAGKTLEDMAKEYNADLREVKGVALDNSSADSLQNQDVLDAAFNYAETETSRVIETDDALVVVRVNKIHEPYTKSLDDVRAEIRALWLENEKSALARELSADIMNSLESGENISAVAERYGLKLYQSQPITRNETFANIDYADVREMFAEPLQTPRQIQQGEDFIVAVSDRDFKDSTPLTEAEKALVQNKAYLAIKRDFADILTAAYANQYKIRIKYKLLGLSD